MVYNGICKQFGFFMTYLYNFVINYILGGMKEYQELIGKITIVIAIVVAGVLIANAFRWLNYKKWGYF